MILNNFLSLLISEVWLARNPPCFAFAVYKYRADAEEAIREMDGRVVCGQRIRCSWAKPRVRGGRNNSRLPERPADPNLRCFTCGERGHFARDCRRSGGRRERRHSSDDDDDRRRRSRRYAIHYNYI